MTAPARRVCYGLLQRIERGACSDDALNSEAVARLEPRDRNLVTEITYGSLRFQGWLDYILSQSVSRPWAEVDPGIRIILRMSLYQAARMDRVPDHAVINDAVELAKQGGRGAGGFVNGVLRHLARRRPWEAEGFERECPPWVPASLPKWLWERWSERYGPSRAMEFARSINHPPQTALRARQTGVSGPPEGAVPSDLVPGAYLPGPGLSGGEAYRIQDEASQLIPFLFGDVEGRAVWDACAAPGGKSAILREMAGAAGLVVSSDLRPSRMLRSFGLQPAFLVADARSPAPFRRSFDAVLADVPCSGLGTLRRNPEIKWRFSPERFDSLARSQNAILEAVSAAVAPGGRLIYSTCSTEPEENERILDGFLARNPSFRVEKPRTPPGIERLLDERGLMRTFPGMRLWDGFFAALMKRDQ